MRHLVIVLSCSILAVSLAYAVEKEDLKTKRDKVSYSIGVNFGSNLKKESLDLNGDLIAKGLKDALAGKAALSDSEVRQILQSFQQELMAKRQEEAKKAGERNKKEGEEFLAQNSKKPGVKTLPSGLQYKILQEGSGKQPKATDKVTVNYKGTLLDGTEFDSSYKRGKPASFAVNGVIKGWTEALQLMKEGAKWQLFIPSDLAYGEKGAGRDIGPNAVLIFEVELISVN